MKKPEKNHDTGLRILEILKIIVNNDVTRKDLIEKLKSNKDFAQIYSKEVLLKYFYTFNSIGLNVKKENDTYSLEKALYNINFSNKEKKVIYNLISGIEKLNNKIEENNAWKIFSKINKYTAIDLSEMYLKSLEEKKYIYNNNIKANVITTLKNMLYDNQSIMLTYIKNNGLEEQITIELKEIIERNGNIFIVCYNPKFGRNKKINIDSIKSIKQLPNKTPNISLLNSVVFEVYGRLASIYKLKPSEQVIDFSNNRMTISNTEEDKDILLLRLLKYGENCKIVKPISLQKEFIELTNNILKNLESNDV